MTERTLVWKNATFSINDDLCVNLGNLTITPSDLIVLIGGNGSGKTSLARALNAELPLKSGEAPENYHPVLVSFEKQMQLLEDDYKMRNNDNASEEEAFGITPNKLFANTDPDVLKEAIAGMHLEKLLDRPIRQLSGGEGRKVLLAKALCSKPNLVIFDTPFDALDVQTRAELLKLIDEIHIKYKTPTILIVNRPSEIPDTLTEMGIIQNLQITKLSTREEIEKDPDAIALLGNAKLPDITLPQTPKKFALKELKDDTIVKLHNVTVAYSRVVLDKLNFEVKRGEHWQIIGPNGAGKSTLMKCLFGIYRMDAGEVILDGKKIEINNPDEAMKYGIAMVHQELQPVPARSVAENLYLGRFPTKGFGPFKMIDHKTMYAETERWLKEVKMDFDPKAQLGSLSIGQMQSVEIAKAVSQQAKVVIFDEPTSSLSDNEVEALFRIMNDLRDKGVAMVYISHKMDEIKRIADDITIMRDGTYVGTWPAAELSTDQIIAKMVGRELTNVYPPKENKPGEVIMEVKDLCSIHEKSFQHVSFELRKGEILGFGGLVGAQRTELMEGIFGIRGIASGEIYMHGKKTRIKHPIDAMNAGIGLITEDRRGNGIFGCLSIKDNVGVSVYNKFLKAGFVLDHKKINQVVDDSIKKLSIKTPSMKEHIANLSGGNQQKVIVARWLANDPDVLIMDEPTRGIDVGAKHEIYEIMSDLAKQGKAIIMISSEMSELLGMADRICVMCNGKLTGEIDQPEGMTQARVMGFATKF